MTKADFARALHLSPKNVSDFMTKPGTGSSVCHSAHAWFKQRDVLKIKTPNVKKRQQQDDQKAAEAAALSVTTPAAKKAKTSSSSTLPDLRQIYLYGEETDEVPVYDTCDEIRRKINLHLKIPGLTQAQFCRDLYAQLQAPKCKQIASKQLADFRSQHGPRTGAKSTVFYAAYVYFEKLRITQGKQKSKHRETMEGLHPLGFDRDTDHRTT
ncbi:hypothetical protein BKA67DRAFT_589931 [Truncatella angustata]|uniref:DUF7726 domain-containing protein n=1 Tax=Truncatella angustata TaxID=152316 RepID=A0A9P8UY48_9PEZI|nr:uncharacterized protein BKA67DRAFT_589931 [Truncatella angustata]KAH6660520.1 hypothetical protein BKA67DRAFT_589931 [Truncatella angustata]